MSDTLKWPAFESCPVVMNRFLDKLGVPKKYKISDLLSFDEEFLISVPPPLAILLVFPFSEQDDKYCREYEELSKTRNQPLDSNVYFMRQTISTACGTIALIHAIANNLDQIKISIRPDAVIKEFIEATKSSNPDIKAEILEHSQEISAALCDSLDRDLGDNCEHHFITIVSVEGRLFELDGRKLTPVFHGTTSEKTFLRDAVLVCKEYMERDPDNINFTALTFGAT